MRVLWYNKATSANTTITGGSDSFPLNNMYSNQLVTKTLVDGGIEIDFGIPTLVDSLVFNSSADNIVIKAGTTTAYSDFTESISGLLDNPVYFLSSAQTYRYWQILPYTTNPLDIDYTDATQQNWNNPDAQNASQASFVPVGMSSGFPSFNISNNNLEYWTATTAENTTSVWSAQGSNSDPFAGNLITNAEFGGGGSTFTDFAAAPTGVYSFIASGSEGFCNYYYDQTSWETAFDNEDAGLFPIRIAQSSSVYKGTIAFENLVIDSEGLIGPAGGNLDPTNSTLVNYLFLGEQTTLAGVQVGSTPIPVSNDVNVRSASQQLYRTPGIIRNEQGFEVFAANRSEWKLFDDWWRSSDRVNNFYFVQFEECMDEFPPYFAYVSDYSDLTRNRSQAYSYDFSIEEVK